MKFQGLLCFMLVGLNQALVLADYQNKFLQNLINYAKIFIPQMKSSVANFDHILNEINVLIKYGAIDISQECSPFSYMEIAIHNLSFAPSTLSFLEVNITNSFYFLMRNDSARFWEAHDIIKNNGQQKDKRYNITSLFPQLQSYFPGIFNKNDPEFNQTQQSILINLIELWSDLMIEYEEKVVLENRVAAVTKCVNRYQSYNYLLNPTRYYKDTNGPIRYYYGRIPNGFYLTNGSVVTGYTVLGNVREKALKDRVDLYYPTKYERWN